MDAAVSAGVGWRIDDRKGGEATEGVDEDKSLYVGFAGLNAGGRAKVERGQASCDHGGSREERAWWTSVVWGSVVETKGDFFESELFCCAPFQTLRASDEAPGSITSLAAHRGPLEGEEGQTPR